MPLCKNGLIAVGLNMALVPVGDKKLDGSRRLLNGKVGMDKGNLAAEAKSEMES